MHLLDVEDSTTETKKQFWITFICVSVITYLIAVSALSGMKQRKQL
jgi:hypothetical protein